MTSLEAFKVEVKDLAARIGVTPKEIHVREMRRKLASCSTRGRLTFDLSLLRESEGTRRGVVVHELLHLRYPNHGKMFQRMLKVYSRPNPPRIQCD